MLNAASPRGVGREPSSVLGAGFGTHSALYSQRQAAVHCYQLGAAIHTILQGGAGMPCATPTESRVQEQPVAAAMAQVALIRGWRPTLA